ncbi:hypothetical protein D3C86_1435250 [compost metagenome]
MQSARLLDSVVNLLLSWKRGVAIIADWLLAEGGDHLIQIRMARTHGIESLGALGLSLGLSGRHHRIHISFTRAGTTQPLDWLGCIPLLYPALEGIHGHGLDGPQPFPTLFVVRQIAFPGGLLIGKAHHHLVLVKLAGLGVHLVHHIDHLAIWLVTDEHIDMITVRPQGAFDVAVVMGHG